MFGSIKVNTTEGVCDVIRRIKEATEKMVRPACHEDIPRLVDLGREFFNTSDLGQVMEYDPESAAKTFEALMKGEESKILVIELDGAVVGGAGGLITPFYFNFTHKVAQEFFWFVSERYRGTLDSVRLFSALEGWAKSKGANSISMVALGCNYEAVSAFYTRRGFLKQETSFLKRL